MTTTKGYNGHKNYNHWNVSLWINNDLGYYEIAKDLIRRSANKDEAAYFMLDHLRNDCEDFQTPDGVRWSLSSIRAAMVGM